MTMIGDSSIDVYPLGLGADPFGGAVETRDAERILDEYAEAGGNFVVAAGDCRPGISGGDATESECIIGKWWTSRGNRDQIVLATRVKGAEGGLSAGAVKSAAEDSLRRLRTDHLDLYCAPIDEVAVPSEVTALATIVKAFADLQAEGKIRAVGLCGQSGKRTAAWIEVADRLGVPRPVAVQPQFGLAFRAQFETGLRPVAAANRLAVLPFVSAAGESSANSGWEGQPIANRQPGANGESGALQATVHEIADAHNVEPAAVAIAWLLHQDGVTAPIAPVFRREQLASFFEGVSIVPAADELAALDAVSTKSGF